MTPSGDTDRARELERARRKRWRDKTRNDAEQIERRRASKKKWRDANRRSPQFLAAKSAAARRYREKNRERLREYDRRYWLTVRKARRAAAAKVYPAFEEMRVRELMRIDIYAAARAALPKGLPDFVRDDVITEIVLAHLEGRLALADVPTRAPDFLRAYRRDFDQWKIVSLDAPIPGTDLRYIDRLAAPTAEAHA
jgi:hypothetical protein